MVASAFGAVSPEAMRQQTLNNIRTLMFTVYILRSKLKEWYYIGHTSDIDRRLEEHNNKRCKSTSPYAQFDMVYFENFDNKSEAFLREMQIKKYRHGEAFNALLKK